MIRNGIPANDIEAYLHERAWLHDAARLLAGSPQDLTTELIETMLRSGTVTQSGGRLHASAERAPVQQSTLEVPHPRDWP